MNFSGLFILNLLYVTVVKKQYFYYTFRDFSLRTKYSVLFWSDTNPFSAISLCSYSLLSEIMGHPTFYPCPLLPTFLYYLLPFFPTFLITFYPRPPLFLLSFLPSSPELGTRTASSLIRINASPRQWRGDKNVMRAAVPGIFKIWIGIGWLDKYFGNFRYFYPPPHPPPPF